MVKKNSSREINPADAFRKTQRAKEVARNKKERQLQREAFTLRSDPETLRQQLKDVLQAEEAGPLNANMRLRKKTLQQAYDQAIKQQLEAKGSVVESMDSGQSESQRSHQYTTTPNEIPLPFQRPKPARTVTGASWEAQVPPPWLPAIPAMPNDASGSQSHLLYGSIPSHGHFRAPAGTLVPTAPLNAPQPAPPGADGYQTGSQPLANPIISKKSTVASLPKAHQDATVTSMIPPSLLARRKAPKLQNVEQVPLSRAGFGLVPKPCPSNAGDRKVNAASSTGVDAKYDTFLHDLNELGAFD